MLYHLSRWGGLTMALRKRGKYRYGDTQADTRAEVLRYSRENGYVARHFADAVCACGGRVFSVLLDDDEGAAARECVACKHQHPIGDSEEYLDEADLGQCACPCGGEAFEVTAGVALYEGSDDVRWFYLGFRCPSCGLTAVYGDWKSESGNYRELLARV
jgi:hypothetical protein